MLRERLDAPNQIADIGTLTAPIRVEFVKGEKL